MIEAKGKGKMQTYWLDLHRRDSVIGQRSERVLSNIVKSADDSSVSDGSDTATPKSSQATMRDVMKPVINGKTKRLIMWNVEVLQKGLRGILAHRSMNQKRVSAVQLEDSRLTEKGSILDEITDSFPLDSRGERRCNPDNVELPPEAVSQLEDFVSTIAALYNDDCSFHCFEHASHVTMSVTKLLARVVSSECSEFNEFRYQTSADDRTKHPTFIKGITTDPMVHFACAFATLVHDVDHSGVTNTQLLTEGHEVAKTYPSSCHEQNAVDVAWQLLMEPSYSDLRACIYSTKDEYNRFRQLFVNLVIATDVLDEKLASLRSRRWQQAFNHDSAPVEASPQDDDNRKATIVLELMIQVSSPDVVSFV